MKLIDLIVELYNRERESQILEDFDSFNIEAAAIMPYGYTKEEILEACKQFDLVVEQSYLEPEESFSILMTLANLAKIDT